MTPPLSRELFAVTDKYRYFNHAAAGVLPRPTKEALQRFVAAHAEGGILGTWPYERDMPQFRARIASFIGGQPSGIAVLRNTGDGANAIAGGFPWEPGDEIAMPDNEFPANVQPWLRARKRGAVVRFVPAAETRLTPDALRAFMTPRTRIVTVSWVSFEDGYRHDLAKLAEVAHAAGAFFCVDAIQGLGAFPIDVAQCGIDALYSGGAKWLLALQGVSFLYVASPLLERLEVASPGWRSTSDIWDFYDYEQPFAQDAARFEGGTPNFIGALSLAESISVLQAAGTDAIARHVLGLTDRLVEGLHRIGADVRSMRGANASSGIVTFRLPASDSVQLGKALQQQGFVTTYRPGGIRVAPHGYNTAEEIDAFVDSLAACRKEVQCSQ